VNDVPLARRADGRDHSDQVGRVPLDGVRQRAAGHGLVRDDEQVTQCFASTSSINPTRSPLKTACLAPGTPYSYGLPTTCGSSSKLNTGGGELTCHSSVSARHGLPDASGPCAHERAML